MPPIIPALLWRWRYIQSHMHSQSVGHRIPDIAPHHSWHGDTAPALRRSRGSVHLPNGSSHRRTGYAYNTCLRSRSPAKCSHPPSASGLRIVHRSRRLPQSMPQFLFAPYSSHLPDHGPWLFYFTIPHRLRDIYAHSQTQGTGVVRNLPRLHYLSGSERWLVSRPFSFEPAGRSMGRTNPSTNARYSACSSPKNRSSGP